MSAKTDIIAEPDKQQILVLREFDLSVEELFEAFTVPEYIEQWMGTKVEKMEPNRNGAFRFITTDPMGNTHAFSGVFHEFESNVKITRTFEMENTGFAVQLEYLEFSSTDEGKSILKMQMVFKSVEMRDNLLKMPFAFGINMAHDRLQSIMQNKSI